MKAKTSSAALFGIGMLLCANSANAQVQKPSATPAPPTAAVPPSSPALPQPMAAANLGQAITLGNVAYKVSTKKVLAAGLEYYGMTPTVGGAATRKYLRSNGRYNPTEFTQAHYEAFVNTGKASSLGSAPDDRQGNRHPGACEHREYGRIARLERNERPRGL